MGSDSTNNAVVLNRIASRKTPERPKLAYASVMVIRSINIPEPWDKKLGIRHSCLHLGTHDVLIKALPQHAQTLPMSYLSVAGAAVGT
jgi:hypothetical protein